jgi:predicted porin
MQKKIIALAVAAAMTAPAMAFADASVYGIVDVAVLANNTTNTKSTIQVISGGLSTSRFGINASEDLGNGMKAFANLEYGLDAANNTTIGVKTDGTLNARQQAVGLSGGFGTVRAGWLQDAGYYWAGKFDPTAGSAVDSVAATNPTTYITTSGRINSAIDYTSPNMSGFSVEISHSFNQGIDPAPPSGATTGNLTTVTVVNAMYDAGPLAVGFAYASDANDDTGFAKNTDMALGASYDFVAAKVYATYLSHKSDTGVAPSDSTNTGISLSAVAPVGADSVVGTLAKETVDSTAADDDKTGLTLAYLHNMSKMTTLYGALQKVTNGGGANVDKTNVALGVRYKF